MSDESNVISPEEAALKTLFDLKPGEKNSEFKLAWNYLQRFAAWGVKLPVKDPDFERILQTTDYARFDFFPFLKDGCIKVQSASETFMTTYLPNILSVGNSLHVFAQNAAEGQGDMFQDVIDLVTGSNPSFVDAKDIVDDMIRDAKDAHKKSKDVLTDLGAFKAELTKAKGNFKDAKDKIDANTEVNQAKIDSLTDPSLKTSLAHLEAERLKTQAEYDHDKTVAWTTLTYAWVGFPFLPVGLIAAGTVAAIYGPKAAAEAEELEALETKLKAAGQELRTAFGTQTALRLGEDANDKLHAYTDKAVDKVTAVQNGWNSIITNLEGLSGQIDRAVHVTDEGEKLKSATLVKIKMTHAREWWTKLYPLIKEASTDPYINVDSEPKSITDFKKDIEAIQAQAA